MAKSSCALLALAATTAHCASLSNQVQANPIRKVVTMLQNLKAKVEGEGAKEREMHEKYMCYCKNGAASLEKSLEDAGVKFPQLEAEIKEAEAKKAGLDGDIANHKADQVAAKTAMNEAVALREKELAQYEKDVADEQAELTPINQALTALGALGGGAPAGNHSVASFIQSSAARSLKKLIQSKSDMNDGDRSELISFLSADSNMIPGGSEITGILHTMKDTVNETIAELNSTEVRSVEDYEGLMEAKKKELAPLQAMIEEKLVRASDIPVAIVQMKNDLGDTGEQMLQDKKFLGDLGGNCATKEKFFEENVRNRGQEIMALADTIKVLNDDDALELFKKTLPGASFLVQISETNEAMRARALSALASVKVHNVDNVGVDFIMLSLNGRKEGYDKVVKLIDDSMASLRKEGRDDAAKKQYCSRQFDQSDDKKKALETELADHESTLADLESVPAQLAEDIDALGDGIRDLDKSVAEATAQRKEEADDYAPLMANDAAAKELILFAKNRLNKFYNPKLHKPKERELSDEDRATLAAGGTLPPLPEAGGIAGTGIGFAQRLPPAPEAIAAYSNKNEQNTGVIALMDLIVKDLDREIHENQATEKSAQKDYQNFMRDASAKRSKDAHALTDKEGALADTKARLLEVKDSKGASEKNLMEVGQYIGNLHAECDFLIKYFDMRQEARNNEIDAMQRAKAILKGADYSFLQSKTFLHMK